MSWRDLEPTSRQASFILRIAEETGYDVPTLLTRGEAADFIGDYLAEHPELRDTLRRAQKRRRAFRRHVRLEGERGQVA